MRTVHTTVLPLLSCVGTRPIYDIGCREVRGREGKLEEDEWGEREGQPLAHPQDRETGVALHQMHNRCTRCRDGGGGGKSSQKERRSLKEQQQVVGRRLAARGECQAWQSRQVVVGQVTPLPPHIQVAATRNRRRQVLLPTLLVIGFHLTVLAHCLPLWRPVSGDLFPAPDKRLVMWRIAWSS